MAVVTKTLKDGLLQSFLAKFWDDGSGNLVPALGADPSLPTFVSVSTDGTDGFASQNNGSGAGFSVTVPAVAGKTAYIVGVTLTGTGATAEKAPTLTIDGLIGGEMYLTGYVPAGTAKSWAFPQWPNPGRPVPASAPNTAVSFAFAGSGPGAGLASMQVQYFYR